MTENLTKTARNQSMELCKLIASVFVVFIHALFPGRLGDVMDCLARFAVPLFFAISGYFSYRANDRKIVRRLGRIIKLNVIATAVCALWSCHRIKYITMDQGRMDYLLSGFSAEGLADWLVLNINPYYHHLWYLTSIAFCYLILWVYVRFGENEQVNYRPLYFVSFFCFILQLALGTFAVAAEHWVSLLIYRNTLFFGLPMFTLGIFLREYRERILRAFRLTTPRLLLLIAGGAVLSLIQWFGIGKVEMPVGTVLEVIALLLLLAVHPQLTARRGWLEKLFPIMGSVSTFVYIMHPIVQGIYAAYDLNGFLPLPANLEGCLRPLLIAFGTMAVGFLFIPLWDLVKARLHRK